MGPGCEWSKNCSICDSASLITAEMFTEIVCSKLFSIYEYQTTLKIAHNVYLHVAWFG